MITEQLMIVFKFETLDAQVAIQTIRRQLSEQGIPSTGFELYERPVDLARMQSRAAIKDGFDLKGRGFEFRHAVLGNYDLDFLMITAGGQPRAVWDKWVAAFADDPNFVMSWVANQEYDHWQNAEDFLEYSSAGKPYDHFPTRSNGAPPPLEQMVVDISNNPGRWALHLGYYEAVGAVMWLGEPFWKLAKANASEVEHASWLKISRPQPAVIRLEAFERCFASDEGGEGDLQRRLRSLLFPSSDRDK